MLIGLSSFPAASFMPSTVSKLLNSISARLHVAHTIRWGEPVPSASSGIYIVSLSNDPDGDDGILDSAPIDIEVVRQWLYRVPSFKIDGIGDPSPEDVVRRLQRFWLQDENILYIGQTSRPLEKRVNELYGHRLGDRRPHSGGHWIQTLSALNNKNAFVHFCEVEDLENVKQRLIESFIDNVSDQTKKQLRDCGPFLPFANRKTPDGKRKKHGIRCSTLIR